MLTLKATHFPGKGPLKARTFKTPLLTITKDNIKLSSYSPGCPPNGLISQGIKSQACRGLHIEKRLPHIKIPSQATKLSRYAALQAQRLYCTSEKTGYCLELKSPFWMTGNAAGSMAETAVPSAALFIAGRYTLLAPAVTGTGSRQGPCAGRNAKGQSKNGFFKFILHAFFSLLF